MPSSFWVASTKRDRGPEADTKASLAMPTIGGRAGFAGTTVIYCWQWHYIAAASASAPALHASRNACANDGSNWVPAQRSISLSARDIGNARR